MTVKPKPEKKTESYDDFRNRVLLICARESEDVAPPTVTKGAVKKCVLYFTDPAKNSDKMYVAEIVRIGSQYNVHFAYGRRGGTLKEGVKTDNPVGLMQAERIYDDLVREKKDKGYTENIGGGL